MNDSVDDLQGTWVVISITREGSSAPSDPQVPTQLTLRDGEASGSGGVNRFGTRYDLGREGEISFGHLASTRMAGPAAAMIQEVEFFAALEATRRFDIRDGRLVLREADDTPLVVLTPASTD